MAIEKPPGYSYRACTRLGEAIPDADHAVSVSLPSWEANVGYEEGQDWVVKNMKSGYPRFFIHPSIQSLAEAVLRHHCNLVECAFLFPTEQIAALCVDFILKSSSGNEHTVPELGSAFRVATFFLRDHEKQPDVNAEKPADVMLAAAIVPKHHFDLGKSFWQHSGEGISSRRAEFLHRAYKAGYLVYKDHTSNDKERAIGVKGPKRYQKNPATRSTSVQEKGALTAESVDYSQFIEERFGRNLNTSLEVQAKLAIRARISGCINGTSRLEARSKLNPQTSKPVSETDVYLYPSGMSAIFNSHRIVTKSRGEGKCIMFGFPYIDTLKILQKFGPGVLFYGHGSSQELDDLEARCSAGERFLALYCEFPGNPLLKTPDLQRIRRLADVHGFVVVVDETIGNFLNVHVISASDVVVSSLTKVFSGDSNVMGGCLTLNPKGAYYQDFKEMQRQEYNDNFWPEDAIFMERNSRDFMSRNYRINSNAETLCAMLQKSRVVKEVFYPKLSSSRELFDNFKNPEGGYGGLFSVTFYSKGDAHAFFDALATEKGPSLGTNFTLSCPFVILAHYNELEWAAEFGAEADLVRVSVGLEDTERLLRVFEDALEAVQGGADEGRAKPR